MGSSAKKNPVIFALERLIEQFPDAYENWWWHAKVLHEFLLDKGVRQSLTLSKVRGALTNLSKHGFLTENSYRALKYYRASSASWEDNSSPRDQQGKMPTLPPQRKAPLPKSELQSLNQVLEDMERESRQWSTLDEDVVTMVRIRSIPSKNIVSPY